MVYFLDTTVLHCGCCGFEDNHSTAYDIIRHNGWLTSPICTDEIENIRDRRTKIYHKVIGFKPNGVFTFEDYFRRCFKSVAGSNQNDMLHLTEFFNACLNEIGVEMEDDMDEELIMRMERAIYPKIRNIRTLLGSLIKNFQDDVFSEIHVIERERTSTRKKIKKEIRRKAKLNDPLFNKNKQDVLILIDAIEHSFVNAIPLQFFTEDRFLLNLNGVDSAINNIYSSKHVQPNITIESLDTFSNT